MVAPSPADACLWRRALNCLAAAALVLQNGCIATAVPPTPSQAVRDSFRVVAVVPAQYAPKSNFLISWRHKEGATGKETARMTGAGVATAAATAAIPVVGPIAVLTSALTFGIMTIWDAQSTSKGIVPADTAAAIESAISKAVAGLDVQDALAGQFTKLMAAEPRVRIAAANGAGPGVPEARPDYAQLRAAGIDTVIETAIDEIGFDGCITHNWECPPPQVLVLYMRARARLVRVADGAVLFERPLEYRSGNHDLAYWLADGGRQLGEEFEQAYRALAESVYDEAFLITPIDLPFVSNAWESHCWLEPVYPEFKAFDGYLVDTLQPTLRWTAFPRDVDRRELDPAVLQKIGEVTYDLRIWDEAVEVRNRPANERWRNRIVYERTGLVAPQHTMEVPLAPGSRYYWSVRARFVVDDRSMATRWARWTGCFSDSLYPGHYWFDTPK